MERVIDVAKKLNISVSRVIDFVKSFNSRIKTIDAHSILDDITINRLEYLNKESMADRKKANELLKSKIPKSIIVTAFSKKPITVKKSKNINATKPKDAEQKNKKKKIKAKKKYMPTPSPYFTTSSKFVGKGWGLSKRKG